MWDAIIGAAGLSALLVLIVWGIVRGVRSTRLPVVARRATVVGKRFDVSEAGTTYFVTFQFADGSREEHEVLGEEYGLLQEGDVGALRMQGTWYEGFRREPAAPP